MAITCVKCNVSNQDSIIKCHNCGSQYLMGCKVCQYFEGYCIHCGNKENPYNINIKISANLGCISDIGRHHVTNQDYAGIKKITNETVVLVVADGVSTAYNSENASKITVEKIIDYLQNTSLKPQAVGSAIYAAHDEIVSMDYLSNDKLVEPMATVVVALINNKNVSIGWVGDSRAYIFNKSGRLLTTDDSWVSLAIKNGMSEEEALQSPHAHEITQCLGTRQETPLVNMVQYLAEPEDIIMVCSDGLWNYFNNAQELNLFMGKDMHETCKNLVNFANKCEGHDNISIACYKIPENIDAK
jgi:serine/threonine protein phosphatase PrpC